MTSRRPSGFCEPNRPITDTTPVRSSSPERRQAVTWRPWSAVTNGHRELEGQVGDNLDQSSRVDAIVSFFGMSNLTTVLSQSTPHGLSVRVPALQLLLEGQPDEKPELARLASPVFHVDEHDPPLLLIHGDQDLQAPINQSHELQGRYEAVHRPCQFVIVHEGKHGGPEFFDAQRMTIVKEFLVNSSK